MTYFGVDFFGKMEMRRIRTEVNILFQLEIAVQLLAKVWVLRFTMAFSKIASKHLISG